MCAVPTATPQSGQWGTLPRVGSSWLRAFCSLSSLIVSGADIGARRRSGVPPVGGSVGGEAGPGHLLVEHLGDREAVVEVHAALDSGAHGAPGDVDDAVVAVAVRGDGGSLVPWGDRGGHGKPFRRCGGGVLPAGRGSGGRERIGSAGAEFGAQLGQRAVVTGATPQVPAVDRVTGEAGGQS